MTLILHRPRGRRNQEKRCGGLLRKMVDAKRSGGILVGKCRARRDEKPGEILSWNTLQQRIDQPSYKWRDVAAECHGLELEGHSTIFFLKSPIAIQAPEKAAIFANGLFPFVRPIRVFELSDPRRVGSAAYPALVQGEIRHVEFCVENGGDNCLPM